MRDVDHGYKKTVMDIIRAQDFYLTLGIHTEEGDEVHPASPRERIDEHGEVHQVKETTIAEIGFKHEFGIGVPRRSWLRESVDMFHDKMLDAFQDMIKEGGTLKQAFGYMGAKGQSLIQERIAKGIMPPNSEATIAKKGSSTPLIDEGIFRASIDWKYNKK